MPLYDAVITTGKERYRPIFLTQSTTVFGLLPMALGIGEGAELRAPLAITVIFGLTIATILTLVVVPVVYTLFTPGGGACRKMRAAARRCGRGDEGRARRRMT